MIKISKLLIISLISISLFNGCKSSSPYLSKHAEFTKDGKPYWTELTPISKDRYYGVGSGQLSTRTNSKNRAESFARNEIARQISVQCDSSLIDYYNESGLESYRESLDVLENFSIQVTNLTLRNVIIENNFYDEKTNTYWVIASYDKDNLKDAYQLEANNLKRKIEKYKVRVEKEKFEIQENINSLKNDKSKDQQIELLTNELNKKTDELNTTQTQINEINIEKMLKSYDKVLNDFNNIISE